mmetsp:Transcript_41408/g.46764  ORF Transcript_41408/g.46764 Transcript_41408/m.46764 type:complete len:124 (+) Transcript_41408:207-578(+)
MMNHHRCSPGFDHNDDYYYGHNRRSLLDVINVRIFFYSSSDSFGNLENKLCFRAQRRTQVNRISFQFTRNKQCQIRSIMFYQNQSSYNVFWWQEAGASPSRLFSQHHLCKQHLMSHHSTNSAG